MGPWLHERSSEPPREKQSSRDVPQLWHFFLGTGIFLWCNEEPCGAEPVCMTATGPCLKKALTPGQRKKLYAIADTVVPEKILEVLFEFHLILFK